MKIQHHGSVLDTTSSNGSCPQCCVPKTNPSFFLLAFIYQDKEFLLVKWQELDWYKQGVIYYYVVSVLASEQVKWYYKQSNSKRKNSYGYWNHPLVYYVCLLFELLNVTANVTNKLYIYISSLIFTRSKSSWWLSEWRKEDFCHKVWEIEIQLELFFHHEICLSKPFCLIDNIPPHDQTFSLSQERQTLRLRFFNNISSIYVKNNLSTTGSHICW